MPTELRRLIFDEQELLSALINYAIRSDMRLPSEGTQKLEVNKADGISVTLKYPPNQDGESRDVVFSEAHLAASIILFCRSQDIPVPRDARKVLSQEKNSVAMTMQVHYGNQSPVTAEVARETVEDARSETAAMEAINRLERD